MGLVLEDARSARIGPETMKIKGRRRKGDGNRKRESMTLTFYLVAYCMIQLAEYFPNSILA
jgi:hypothetical protein